MLKKLLGIKTRFHPRTIPNSVPFKFVARLTDGTEVPCETYKTDFAIRMAIRTVESQTKIGYKQIQDWTEIS